MADTSSYPTKPRLKPQPPSTTVPSSSPESSFWKSFKSDSSFFDLLPTTTSSITSLTFSPTHPHTLAATHGASLSLLRPPSTAHSIHSFKDSSFSASFRSDSLLLAASSASSSIHIFDAKSRHQLRLLKSHSRPVRLSKFPFSDNLHLFSGADDSLVKYWDVATETCLINFTGHKDYVRAGSPSPVDDNLFVSGSYDHTVRVWDVRAGSGSGSGSAMGFDHGKPVEDVVVLPSGSLVATAGGNVVKIWDVIGGGRCVYTLDTHNKTVTSICVGKVGKKESEEYRLLSVSLDGYFKVFDYANMKVTFSMRFPAPLVSVAYSPDCSTRAIGTSTGVIYVGKRKTKTKTKERAEDTLGGMRRALKPSSFRYFHRGQNEKPREGDYLVLRQKRVKLAEHDKLLKKFRHKEAFVSVLRKKNPDNVVAVMEELVARKGLFKCVLNLDIQELEDLLMFFQKYTTAPRFAGLLMPFANKVIKMRGDDIQANASLKVHITNMKRSIQEELRIQQSLLELQGVISPLMRIAGRS